jgi:transposase-like protein
VAHPGEASVWRTALVLEACESGRIVNAHAQLATGVKRDGYREILGLHVSTSEDGAEWLASCRDLTKVIGVKQPSASWQRCRTHYAANIMGCHTEVCVGRLQLLDLQSGRQFAVRRQIACR